MKKISLFLVLAILLIPCYAVQTDKGENRIMKMIAKEASRLRKEGWKSSGSLSIEEQLKRIYSITGQYDEDGQPRYVIAQSMARGLTQESARRKSYLSAVEEISGMVASEITLNAEMLNATHKSAMDVGVFVKNRLNVQQPMILMDLYREDPQGFEVSIMLAYDTAMFYKNDGVE